MFSSSCSEFNKRLSSNSSCSNPGIGKIHFGPALALGVIEILGVELFVTLDVTEGSEVGEGEKEREEVGVTLILMLMLKVAEGLEEAVPEAKGLAEGV